MSDDLIDGKLLEQVSVKSFKRFKWEILIISCNEGIENLQIRFPWYFFDQVLFEAIVPDIPKCTEQFFVIFVTCLLRLLSKYLEISYFRIKSFDDTNLVFRRNLFFCILYIKAIRFWRACRSEIETSSFILHIFVWSDFLVR